MSVEIYNREIYGYRLYNIEEFNNLSDDLKWDVYSELVNEFKKILKERDDQFHLLMYKDNDIERLKDIIHKAIDTIGD